MTQMTLEMEVAVAVARKRPEKIHRRWYIKDKSANLIDQLSLLSGRKKQDIIDDAIHIVAAIYSEDPDRIREILEEFYSGSI